VVAKYRCNTIPPMAFADAIVPVALRYNKAFIIIENDGPGYQVADDLHHIHEYENILLVATKGRSGQILATGFGHSGKNVQRGVKMSTPVRRTGCAHLKTLVESKRLIIVDDDIKKELASFELKGDKYQAAEGKHDDLVMTLVVFAWLTGQKHFRDMVEAAVRDDLVTEYAPQFEHDLTPYGWIQTHTEEEVVVTKHDVWKSAQSEIWEDYAERERIRATIDMERLRRLEKIGWA
jgi:Terminase RNaseH-like domain